MKYTYSLLYCSRKCNKPVYMYVHSNYRRRSYLYRSGVGSQVTFYPIKYAASHTIDMIASKRIATKFIPETRKMLCTLYKSFTEKRCIYRLSLPKRTSHVHVQRLKETVYKKCKRRSDRLVDCITHTTTFTVFEDDTKPQSYQKHKVVSTARVKW